VHYGLLEERIVGTMIFVLPSPSGAARAYWDLAPWRDLARLRSAG
jgi:TDG/mug DNA glycosylase family protein